MDHLGIDRCQPEAIASRMRTGDVAALADLSRCYRDRLLAVGRRYCRNQEEAEDAVQDALESAGRHLASYRGEGSPDAWLVTMVVNACRRQHRGRKNDPALHDRDLTAGERLAGHGDPEADAAQAELRAHLVGALDALDPTNRALVVLADFERWSGPDIAQATGLTHGAVRVRLHRARARLREELDRRLQREAAA